MEQTRRAGIPLCPSCKRTIWDASKPCPSCTYDPKDLRGPFYYGVLKNGDVRYFEKKPKRPHVEEYIEGTDDSQSKWHYLTTEDGSAKKDFNSNCGFDRGPRLRNIIRKMLER